MRLSGQDSERGTFSQRHSVLFDQDTEERYTPFNHLGDKQARYEVLNSMLSEEAVLGFEYGYSTAEPNALTLWEAQFGDFANGAQVVFDQFISSGERKWLRMSGLVCLLPHGYEGQGPEHSSARLERYPADVRRRQHAGRQLHDAGELLPHPAPAAEARDPQAADPDDAEVAAAPQARGVAARRDGDRHHVPPPAVGRCAMCCQGEKIKLVADDKIRRVVLCSGKVYYDLYEEREKRGIDDIYLLRVEQLYPFPTKALVTELSRFKQAEIVWCQEEPRNMGAWFFVDVFLRMGAQPISAPSIARRVMPAARRRPRPRSGRCRSTSRSSSSSSKRRWGKNSLVSPEGEGRRASNGSEMRPWGQQTRSPTRRSLRHGDSSRGGEGKIGSYYG